MAIEKRGGSWEDSSIPTKDDFNRIENNINTLDESKEPKIDVLPVSKGGTGASSFTKDHLIIGNGGEALTDADPDDVTVGKAKCDESGRNIAGTYLGTDKTLLTEVDAPIGYNVPITLKAPIEDFKYLIFLLRGGSQEQKYASCCTIERDLFVKFFKRDYPLILESGNIRLFFCYDESGNRLVPILTNYKCLLTVYGVN